MLNPQEIEPGMLTGERRPFRSVLIVEDEGLLSLMLEDLVRAEGAEEVHSCRSTGEALDVVAAKALDCAILDVSLRTGTTYEVADSLASGAVPFLFCTGLNLEDIEVRHRDRPLLSKPYGDADFRNALNLALRR